MCLSLFWAVSAPSPPPAPPALAWLSRGFLQTIDSGWDPLGLAVSSKESILVFFSASPPWPWPLFNSSSSGDSAFLQDWDMGWQEVRELQDMGPNGTQEGLVVVGRMCWGTVQNESSFIESRKWGVGTQLLCHVWNNSHSHGNARSSKCQGYKDPTPLWVVSVVFNSKTLLTHYRYPPEYPPEFAAPSSKAEWQWGKHL